MSIKALLELKTEEQEWANLRCNTVNSGLANNYTLSYGAELKAPDEFCLANGTPIDASPGVVLRAENELVIPKDGVINAVSWRKTVNTPSTAILVLNQNLVRTLDTTTLSGVQDNVFLPVNAGDRLAIRCGAVAMGDTSFMVLLG